jgi:hypothetical protein
LSKAWAAKSSTSRFRHQAANLDKLLEAILLQAELLDLKANPDRTAEGVVIEAKLDVAAVRLPPCWFSRHAQAGRHRVPATSGAVSAR